MNVRYIVELSDTELETLETMVSQGSARVRRLKRAQVLLAAHRGEGDETIAKTVSVGTSTVYRTKRRFVEGGLELALEEKDTDEEFICGHAVAVANLALRFGISVSVTHDLLPERLLVSPRDR